MDAKPHSPTRPRRFGVFLLGTAIGSIAGALVAMVIGAKGRDAVDRIVDLTPFKDRDELKFELLLQ